MSNRIPLDQIYRESVEEGLPLSLEQVRDKTSRNQMLLVLGLEGEHRTIAVCRYVLFDDVDGFRQHMRLSVAVNFSMVDRYEQGEEGFAESVNEYAYAGLFNALAVGDRTLAERFVERWKTHPLPKRGGHAFSRLIAHALYRVVTDHPEADARVADFEQHFAAGKDKASRGYATVLRGIVNRDTALTDSGLTELLKGHKRLSSGSGMFALTVDKDLYVWGVGLANLARMKGLAVDPAHPLIPTALLI